MASLGIIVGLVLIIILWSWVSYGVKYANKGKN